eukprot:TRINITY_DN81119_c0_g1_i1.p1 TRINITY_DN81119_c0_g1~~TRINITY_DN81119_c0_g1_i1.p1  ORF type:complete len:321 (-),score=93.06 TRINITY_DN81119_c0_g1_i1:600-1562(-)
MGNTAVECCADRKDPPRNSAAAPKAGAAPKAAASSDAQRKSAHAYDATKAKNRAASIAAGGVEPGKKATLSAHTKSEDSEKFDKAFEEKNIRAFVELLASNQPIEPFADRMHPWAEDPRTIGALAGTQLALLASSAPKEDSTIKDEIRKSGGIKALVEYLKSDQVDRVQTAVVALNFITSDNDANAIEAYNCGAMKFLLDHVADKVPGMRAASVTILHHICMQNEQYQTEFVEMRGLEALVAQLDPTENSGLNDADILLEAVLNLMDLVELEDGTLIQEYAKRAVAAGAIEKLKKLTEADDEDLRGSAEELLADLAKVKQ